MTINRDVSPLGNHSLTISVEDDEGFQTEATAHYFLEEDIKPTGLLTVYDITIDCNIYLCQIDIILISLQSQL